jgi:pimeloyl-ACP methyl ester carboxylesterase
MLILAYAAEWLSRPAALVLVGCGTFSLAARTEFEARYAARLTDVHRAALAHIERSEPDADRRLASQGRVITRVYGYDIEDEGPDLVTVDAVAHRETWSDMVRLLNEGAYPAGLAAIRCPVLMLHGDTDPHPGPGTRDDLREYIPHLEYRELARCGHSPWLERQAREEFFGHIDGWITNQWAANQ